METMGQKFTAAREKKKLTISRAASLTRIKVQHLELMEADDFSQMPAPTYAKGFIRIYSELLGLDAEPLVREYVEKHLEQSAQKTHSSAHGKKIRAGRKKEEKFDFVSLEIIQKLRKLLGEWVKTLPAFAPRIPRVILTVAIVFLLVGIMRWAVRMAGDKSAIEAERNLLDKGAIMKEPGVRYFNLPKTEDEQP